MFPASHLLHAFFLQQQEVQQQKKQQALLAKSRFPFRDQANEEENNNDDYEREDELPCQILTPQTFGNVKDCEWMRLSSSSVLPRGWLRFSLPAFGIEWKQMILSSPVSILFSVLRLIPAEADTEIDYSLVNVATELPAATTLPLQMTPTRLILQELEENNALPSTNSWFVLGNETSREEAVSVHKTNRWVAENVLPGLVAQYQWVLDVCLAKQPLASSSSNAINNNNNNNNNINNNSVHLFAAVYAGDGRSGVGSSIAPALQLEFPIRPLFCQACPNRIQIMRGKQQQQQRRQAVTPPQHHHHQRLAKYAEVFEKKFGMARGGSGGGGGGGDAASASNGNAEATVPLFAIPRGARQYAFCLPWEDLGRHIREMVKKNE